MNVYMCVFVYGIDDIASPPLRQWTNPSTTDNKTNKAERVEPNAPHRLAETTLVHRIFAGYLRSQVCLYVYTCGYHIDIGNAFVCPSLKRPVLHYNTEIQSNPTNQKPPPNSQSPPPQQHQVRCTSCGFCSNTYETFLDLSLEIHGRVASLEEALARFTAVETLDKANRCVGVGVEEYVW